MTVDAGRPQDQGRRHRRKGIPSPETASLLARAQQAMRDELSGLLDDIAGRVPDPGLRLLDDAIERGDIAERVRSPLKDRAPMWDLAIKLMRELGTEVDPGPGTDSSAPAPRTRRRGPVDFG